MLISGIVQTFYVEGFTVATIRSLQRRDEGIWNHRRKELNLSCGLIEGKRFC